MPDFRERVALITGGSGGIAVGIARVFIAAGARVALTDIDGAGLGAAVATIGQGCFGVAADVANAPSMDAAVKGVIEKWGRLDFVIANAGVGNSAPLGHITEKQFELIYGVNVKGVVFTIQAALPHLPSDGAALIIGSTASSRSEYGMSLYGGSKAALRQMVRTWTRELKGSGLRVNIVSPGAIDTPSLRSALAGSLGAEKVEARVKEMGEGNPVGRLGLPIDIGHAAAFLCSPEASFVSGVELFVDGGMAQI